MGLADLFGAIRRREQSQRATAKARYLELVARAAAEKAVDVDFAADVVDAAGKTAADFEADVRRSRNRVELRARIDRAKEARPKLKKLELRAAEIEDEFRRAQTTFQADLEAVQAEARPLEQVVSLAAGAEQQLVDSCPNEELVAEYRQACREAAELGEVLRHRREDLLQTEIHHAGLRLLPKVREAIERERAARQDEWEKRVARLEEIAADPESHLRGRREPLLKEAVQALALAEKRRADLERAILEA